VLLPFNRSSKSALKRGRIHLWEYSKKANIEKSKEWQKMFPTRWIDLELSLELTARLTAYLGYLVKGKKHSKQGIPLFDGVSPNAVSKIIKDMCNKYLEKDLTADTLRAIWTTDQMNEDYRQMTHTEQRVLHSQLLHSKEIAEKVYQKVTGKPFEEPAKEAPKPVIVAEPEPEPEVVEEPKAVEVKKPKRVRKPKAKPVEGTTEYLIEQLKEAIKKRK